MQLHEEHEMFKWKQRSNGPSENILIERIMKLIFVVSFELMPFGIFVLLTYIPQIS